MKLDWGSVPGWAAAAILLCARLKAWGETADT
jgi:hypothetical protein